MFLSIPNDNYICTVLKLLCALSLKNPRKGNTIKWYKLII